MTFMKNEFRIVMELAGNFKVLLKLHFEFSHICLSQHIYCIVSFFNNYQNNLQK